MFQAGGLIMYVVFLCLFFKDNKQVVMFTLNCFTHIMTKTNKLLQRGLIFELSVLINTALVVHLLLAATDPGY